MSLNAKVCQLEIENNPSYSTGNIAREDFNKNRQTVNTKRKFGDEVNSVRRKNCYQETRRDSPNETVLTSMKSGCGMQSKCTLIQPKHKPEENIEMNPSYSTVPLAGVGEYALIGPLYEKTLMDKKSNMSASLKMKGGDIKVHRASPRAKSFTSSSHKKQRDRSFNDSSKGAHQLHVESNPAYSTLPSTDGEYSLVGPAYNKAAQALDTKTKHEYAEIKETKTVTESVKDNPQDKQKSRYVMFNNYVILAFIDCTLKKLLNTVKFYPVM